METNGGAARIAVMIDADNTRASYAEEVLSEVARYGNPTIRRVYGDWTNPHLAKWARILNRMGLRAMHQNAYTTGKNSTDLALVIDAMDLLYDGNVEAFALVTSDSDFTSLAHRLRESGKTVYVLGEKKAPDALKNACDKFIDLGLAHGAKEAEADDEPDEEPDSGSDAAPTPAINLESALTRATNAVSDDEGWALLPALGNQLIRTHPSFDARNFGDRDARLSTLVEAQPYLETTGSGNTLRVRVKGRGPARAGKQAAKKAVAKKAESTKVAPRKAAPTKAAPKQAASKQAASKQAASKQAASKQAASKQAASTTTPMVTQTKRS